MRDRLSRDNAHYAYYSTGGEKVMGNKKWHLIILLFVTSSDKFRAHCFPSAEMTFHFLAFPRDEGAGPCQH
jgi:hypothetical protein